MSHPLPHDGNMENSTSFKPSSFFFRRALRQARDKETAVAIGMTLVLELEAHKEFIRSLGYIPPKRYLTLAEIEEKHWAQALRSESLSL